VSRHIDYQKVRDGKLARAVREDRNYRARQIARKWVEGKDVDTSTRQFWMEIGAFDAFDHIVSTE
jgi:hypothetical protein